MPGQARAIGAWISTQCLTNSSCVIPGLRASREALLIVKPPELESAAQALAAIPPKPIRVLRRVAVVTLRFEDIIAPVYKYLLTTLCARPAIRASRKTPPPVFRAEE